tara:strand:+ start:1130 stop:1306 length:177 start_codon:yes stop_codon:yes gene_type:complete
MKNLIKKTFRRFFKENPSKLSTKALERASNMQKPRAGTPHDWEDYEKYLKEFEKELDQ